MKTIRLGNIIKGSQYAYLKDLEIDIINVKIIKDKNELHLFLQSKNIIDIDLYEDINLFFKSVFHSIDIKTYIKYLADIHEEKVLKLYFNNIKKKIQEESSSSNSWIDGLDYKIENDVLVLIVPNETALFSMKRNGLIGNLKNLIQN